MKSVTELHESVVFAKDKDPAQLGEQMNRMPLDNIKDYRATLALHTHIQEYLKQNPSLHDHLHSFMKLYLTYKQRLFIERPKYPLDGGKNIVYFTDDNKCIFEANCYYSTEDYCTDAVISFQLGNMPSVMLCSYFDDEIHEMIVDLSTDALNVLQKILFDGKLDGFTIITMLTKLFWTKTSIKFDEFFNIINKKMQPVVISDYLLKRALAHGPFSTRGYYSDQRTCCSCSGFVFVCSSMPVDLEHNNCIVFCMKGCFTVGLLNEANKKQIMWAEHKGKILLRSGGLDEEIKDLVLFL
ncbi:hypothetical protein AKO1_015618 [Acrasis kona]|uniref:Uncharacterized protein n=1 Tax=Acrasis kona TaxID=1008807 RepID=A0AAW2ZIE9_9EUKA